eukprot:CAMPEP_0115679592 /NCGR_PEP_ID=MMETSP0272-20121206/56359_1 /TAXON_ID=71861 /ORGANISM="Scrippsiella trochoidea, Strain CCMP3099" /LENGTH=74 /DNA_ID=CAMNT_0003118823 /DNA_START=417 /DNA_END=641 /DNA_ORIENTATION=-
MPPSSANSAKLAPKNGTLKNKTLLEMFLETEHKTMVLMEKSMAQASKGTAVKSVTTVSMTAQMVKNLAKHSLKR